MEFDVVVEVFDDATEDLIFRKVVTILQFPKKTVEPTWHESRKKKPSDLVLTTENAFKPVAKEVLHIEADAPSKWAAFCKRVLGLDAFELRRGNHPFEAVETLRALLARD